MSRKSKTMIGADVMQSDLYLNLSIPAQALYPQLNLEADQYGIVTGIRRVLRSVGMDEESLKELEEGGYVLAVKPQEGMFALSHWWEMNRWDGHNCNTGHGDTISAELCFVGNSRRYILQEEAQKAAVPSGETAFNYVPVFVQTGTRLEPDWNQSTKEHKEKEAQAKANPTESQEQQQDISKQPQNNKKESRYPGDAMGECPYCHTQAPIISFGTVQAINCPSCGTTPVNTATGERV